MTFLHLLISDGCVALRWRAESADSKTVQSAFREESRADDVFVKLVARRQMARHLRENFYRRSKL